MRYRCAAFDIDGTLLDSAPADLAGLEEALRREWREVPPAKTLMGTFGMPGPDILRALGIPEEAHARISQAWHVFKQANAHRIHLFPGVEDMLRALRARGALLGVVTSKRPESYGRDFTPFGLDGYFDARVTCVDTVLHKPHPEPLRMLLKRLEVAPGEALYVGDSVYDRDCAIAAGVDFALATWGSVQPEMENVTWRLHAPEDLLDIWDT